MLSSMTKLPRFIIKVCQVQPHKSSDLNYKTLVSPYISCLSLWCLSSNLIKTMYSDYKTLDPSLWWLTSKLTKTLAFKLQDWSPSQERSDPSIRRIYNICLKPRIFLFSKSSIFSLQVCSLYKVRTGVASRESLFVLINSINMLTIILFLKHK